MNARDPGVIRPGPARGMVKSYDPKRSPYGGYITEERSGQDVFLHKSAVVTGNPDAPRAGQKVEFDIVEDGFGGFRAQNLRAAK
jgi:cold shock CspA family protein